MGRVAAVYMVVVYESALTSFMYLCQDWLRNHLTEAFVHLLPICSACTVHMYVLCIYVRTYIPTYVHIGSKFRAFVLNSNKRTT